MRANALSSALLGQAQILGGADVGADHYSPVSRSYQAPFEFTGTIHVLDVRVTPRGQYPRPQTPREASESG